MLEYWVGFQFFLLCVTEETMIFSLKYLLNDFAYQGFLYFFYNLLVFFSLVIVQYCGLL